jgi:hypothetical protein
MLLRSEEKSPREGAVMVLETSAWHRGQKALQKEPLNIELCASKIISEVSVLKIVMRAIGSE